VITNESGEAFGAVLVTPTSPKRAVLTIVIPEPDVVPTPDDVMVLPPAVTPVIVKAAEHVKSARARPGRPAPRRRSCPSRRAS
jgi:hypothetical protein